MVCAPGPLNSTVLGTVEVTFKVPAVSVYVPAMPNTASVANCKDVPLIITLLRLALPESIPDPVKVTEPAVAVKLPVTSKPDDMEKLEAVEIEPVAFNLLKVSVPEFVMVLAAPVIITWPALVMRLFADATVKFPETSNDDAAVTVPFM